MKSLLVLFFASGPFLFLSAQETPATSLATINDAAAFLAGEELPRPGRAT